MSRIIDALRRHADADPAHVALEDESGSLSYAELLATVEKLAARLAALSPRVVAILADNGAAWVLADLAAMVAQIPIVPLPLFASSAQIAHTMRTAGIDYVLTDQPDRLCAALARDTYLTMTPFHRGLLGIRFPASEPAPAGLPPGTWKVTFTSGTTAEPKGVCLGIEELENTAESLRIASQGTRADRHLCVLPLATLLENIGGIYTPLLAGATICVPRLAAVGLAGSSALDVARLVAALGEWRATSAIMVPQMLLALVMAGNAGAPMSGSLRYLAVGGAPVPARTLDQARALGLPVYEGYGLSECASVVAVNRPDANRPGSVGKPLPHVRVEFAADGEIVVRGIRWRGYLGGNAAGATADVVATGDLGYLDEDGYLHLTGRKKNIFITSFGRNVAPEWVERELIARAPIMQAALFGEARPFNTAVIVPRPAATTESIAAALDDVNRHLPDYARVHAWIRANEPFSPGNGMSTFNGRLRRAPIYNAYADQINAIYDHKERREAR